MKWSQKVGFLGKKTLTQKEVVSAPRSAWQLLPSFSVRRRHMPVYWSPSSRSALAESELEYDPNHKSHAIYVRFALTEESRGAILKVREESGPKIYVRTPISIALVFRTTTLPYSF